MEGLAQLIGHWARGDGPDLLVLGPAELGELAAPSGALDGCRTGGSVRAGAGPVVDEAVVVGPAPRPWAGVDEVGRGPLAGPVVACAVVLTPGARIPGLRDSKALTPASRQALMAPILAHALDARVAIVSHRMVDRLNVLQASLHAMAASASALEAPYRTLVVDGPVPVPLGRPVAQVPLVDADARVACVGAASVVAKVVRDRLMEEADRVWPGYGFARHKGYPTPEHLAALERLGPSPLHRRSFRPVAAARPAPA